MEQSERILVYVGTYTEGESPLGNRSEGIYLYRMDPATGALTPVSVTPGTVNPSFLALSPGKATLYAVNELTGDQGPSGTVSAFAVDPVTGALSFLNQQSTHGYAPCYVSVEDSGRYALVANYLGGNVCVLPIAEGGRLGEATAVVDHEGSGPHPRQDRAYAHSIMPDPENRYMLALDLGIDKIMVYELDRERGELNPGDPPWAEVPPGSGPRHLAFHPQGGFAYAIHELNSTLTAFAYDGDQGRLETLDTVSTLPPGFAGENYCADIHVAPSGRFLYGSNRGHDSIVIFAIDQATGTLSYVGHESTRGAWPRNFAIDPSGTFLLVANQNSDNIVSFRIDQETGRLLATGHETETPMPVCLRFL